ncbi:tRNA pseudouridine(55) synthase TruB [Schumannella sp. 10F1B-5-1]|uniref:tRNA pseudouridine(55) synthase TruB n=1 Tax=Schumannella sp. 10F1B-5-1 TaxID=2590780 RepID=UPI0011316C00|nr:tRNA pseudouridine(55) synthase TruB [Schumannella sp. 10F1B-5-1]TPW70735.1 tRNA pseudouridine(55) synthase TruB [Schumannella sp. 10F1B-5-1]
MPDESRSAAPESAAPRSPAPSGILVVDKPLGVTSHDVVRVVRRTAGTRKVGHAGTLDPLATGLMMLGVESSTRLLTYLVGLDKEYLATIRLGHGTTTDDAEGESTGGADASALTEAEVGAAIAPLTGDIRQRPSDYSAIKVDGRRAYALARQGEQVELKERAVTVSTFEVLERRVEGAHLDLDVRVEVSSGTYVRALARDLGSALSVGGHLTALRRTRVGPFGLADAAPPDERVLDGMRTPASVASELFPAVTLDPAQLAELVHGRRPALVGPDHELAEADTVAALTPDGRLAGLVSLRRGVARVLINFPTAEVLA